MPPFMEREASKQKSMNKQSGSQVSALGKGEVIVPIDEEPEELIDEPEDDCTHREIREKQTSPDFFFSLQASENEVSAPSPSITASSCSSTPASIFSSSYKKKKKSTALPDKSLNVDAKADPPTKLIENFLQRQAALGNLCLDMDMDMMDNLPQMLAEDDALITNTTANPSFSSNLIHQPSSATSSAPSAIIESSSTKAIPESRYGGKMMQDVVSFKPTHAILETLQEIDKFPTLSQDAGTNQNLVGGNMKSEETLARDDDYESDRSSDDGAQNRSKSVLSSLTRLQTRSRLADPPLLMQQGDAYKNGAYRSAQLRSGQMRSGLIQKSGFMGKADAEEDDDPLKDSDMPDSFRKHRWSPLIVFEWVSFFLVMAALICSLTVPALRQRPLWTMALWKWALLVFLLFCGRLVSGWLIRILVVILERNFLLRKRVLYFVYGLRKGVQNFLWFAFAVLAWRLVFDPKLEKSTNSKVLPLVTKILHCFLIAAALWLVKIFFVKVLASSFHVSTYFERIRESLFGQWVLESLSGPPLMEMEEEANLIEEINDLRRAGAKIPEAILPKNEFGRDAGAPNGAYRNEKMNFTKNNGYVGVGRSGMVGVGKSGMLGVGKSGQMIGGNVGKSGMIGRSGTLRVKSQRNLNMEKMRDVPEETITIDDLQRLNQRNISAWNMKRMMNFVRYRGVCTLAQVIDQSAATAGQDESKDVEIESEWHARNVARRIFKNVAKPGSRLIVKDDLLRFMREAEVEKAMALFEGALETGKITKNALKDFAVHVVRERRALSLSLNDTKTAVKKLHRLVDVVVGVGIAIISMLVLGIATTHLLLLVSSQLLVVVFIFGNTCKNVFEAIVFLFVMHPFDVGDRCVVDGNQVVVEEMNILSTVFMRNDGEKLWYPNSLLATKFIFNYSRTPDTGDTFDFCIDSSTPPHKINALKDRITKYLGNKASVWSREMNLIVKEIENNNKMKMQVMVNHTIDYSNPMERQIRRSDLILEVKKMLQELDFAYHLPVQPLHLNNFPTSDMNSHKSL